MKVDMTPEAITGRMMMLDQLWELAVSLKNSTLGPPVEPQAIARPTVYGKRIREQTRPTSNHASDLTTKYHPDAAGGSD